MPETLQIALIGQPNVGKSTLFTRLTGVGVISSNYPGTTVEFEEATVIRKDKELHFHDLPGTYSLSSNSDDESVVVDMLQDKENDVVVVVADAMNLESGLTLAFEITELGIPYIVALNRMDLASKRVSIDIEKLSKMIGAPVIPVSAKTGEGIEGLLDTITDGKAELSEFQVNYDADVREYISELTLFLENNKLSKRGYAIKLLEDAKGFVNSADPSIYESVKEMQNEYNSKHSFAIDVQIAKDRFATASAIVQKVTSASTHKMTLSERISEMTITPITGVPILIALLAGLLAVLVYGGTFLDGVVSSVYDAVIGNAIVDFGNQFDNEFISAVFVGIDGSFRAILAVVIPYIMVFYILLGIMEDTGYMPRIVVLLDRIMHRFGLHGGSFIPIMVGIGCNVPAIMATRSLSSKRERRIVCSMIIMCVPCSAQLAIIFGTTGAYAGLQYSFLIAAVLVVLACIIGVVMNKYLPSEPSNLAMEIPDLVMPSVKNVLFKTWERIRDFFEIALPLLIVGSIVVELLINYDLLNPIVEPMSFLTVTLLGLPAVTIVGFIIGILRKEMAYGMLVILAGSIPMTEFMTPDQYVIFGMVMAIYLPCVATIAAMGRELGWKDTVAISAVSVIVAIVIGTMFNGILSVF